MTDIPQRFPPPLSESERGPNGERRPVIQPPFIECGQTTRLGGVLVTCIRRQGHPVRINYGHTNGYTEWTFDTP
jgi:hypothetical protein